MEVVRILTVRQAAAALGPLAAPPRGKAADAARAPTMATLAVARAPALDSVTGVLEAPAAVAMAAEMAVAVAVADLERAGVEATEVATCKCSCRSPSTETRAGTV